MGKGQLSLLAHGLVQKDLPDCLCAFCGTWTQLHAPALPSVLNWFTPLKSIEIVRHQTSWIHVNYIQLYTHFYLFFAYFTSIASGFPNFRAKLCSWATLNLCDDVVGRRCGDHPKARAAFHLESSREPLIRHNFCFAQGNSGVFGLEFAEPTWTTMRLVLSSEVKISREFISALFNDIRKT